MFNASPGTISFRFLIVLLLLAPLPFGSILPWAQAILTFCVFALLAVWAIKPYPHPFVFSPAVQSETPGNRSLNSLLIVWLLVVAFAFFQAVPLPPRVLASISPNLHELYSWTLTSPGHESLWKSLSTTPASTLQTGLLIGACGIVFFLVIQHCRSRDRAKAITVTVILVGVGEAIYGLVNVGGDLSHSASGTFVNRNHFAALLAM